MAKKVRELTEAELLRKERFEAKSQEMITQGYTQKNLTIGLLFANIMAIVLLVPVGILFGYMFYIMNQKSVLFIFSLKNGLILLVSSFVLIFVHELIHGITWACFTKDHMKSIEFGVIWRALTPYCTCKTELKRGQYIVGTLMPTLLLGFLPMIIAIIFNAILLFFIAALMIAAGSGDILIILKILFYQEEGKECVYMDHPYEAGLVVFER